MTETTPARQPFEEMETLQINVSDFNPAPSPQNDDSVETENSEVAFSSIRFIPGLVLQIGIADAPKERLNSKLLGIHEGKSLIATTPSIAGARTPLREGQKLLVRTFLGNSIFMFVSSVLKSNLLPYPYMHLSYPATAKVKTVRRATRASTSLIAAASNLHSEINQNCPCRIVDISINGAMLITKQPIAAIGNHLALNFRLRTDAGEHYISVQGSVRSAAPAAEEGVRYGLEFNELDPAQCLVLENFIYRTLFDE